MCDHEPEFLAEIRNIQMLIGRNVLVFQNVEHLLKLINHFRKGSGTPQNILKRKSRIDELSLGRLTDPKVINKIDAKHNKQNDKDFYVNYETLTADKQLDDAIKFFNEINEDRNLLIHNFTSKWPLSKTENIEEAKKWLLNQYEAIFKQREILVSACKIIIERTNIMSDFMSSEECNKIMSEFINSTEEDSITIEFNPEY